MPDINAKNIAIPLTMLGSVVAGSSYITDTRSDLDHLTSRVNNHRSDFKDSISESKDQDERLSRMEGKQDLILHTIKRLEKRFSDE